ANAEQPTTPLTCPPPPPTSNDHTRPNLAHWVDYETHPHRSEAMIHIAMIDLISHRLTRESTPNWRDT
ncbi:hypothetical protein ACF06L_30050, partial [Streptomyces sp. NPDC015408]